MSTGRRRVDGKEAFGAGCWRGAVHRSRLPTSYCLEEISQGSFLLCTTLFLFRFYHAGTLDAIGRLRRNNKVYFLLVLECRDSRGARLFLLWLAVGGVTRSWSARPACLT